MLNKAKCKELFIADSTHPKTLDYLLNGLAPAWLEWEPETTWTKLKKYMGREPSLLTKTKINAMKLLHTSEGPWEDWETFLPTCVALNNGIPNFEIASKPSLAELFVATKLMRSMREYIFSTEVIHFIAACCLDAGILFTPPPLDFVQQTLDIVEYQCSLCGNVDIYDNGKCDICGAPEASLTLVPRHFDWHKVEKKWNALKGKTLESVELGENLVDIHIHKILNAHLVMVESEQQHHEEVRYAQS